MGTLVTEKTYPFLQGGGEMGELTRRYDWSNNPVGGLDQWPQSLRTTLSIILNSKFPMFLFWGPELICFYNDAYRPSLGNNGKHPSTLGMPAKQVWPEIWEFIKPLIDNVLAGGEASWNEDQLLPIFRNGGMEDVYWTFSYSPVMDETGQPTGVFVTCAETTEKVRNLSYLAESKEQLEFAIDAAELGTWDLNPITNKFTANARLKEWFGLRPEEEVPLPMAIEVIAEKDRERVTDAIAKATTYEDGGFYDIDYTIINPITNKERVVNAKGRAWFDDNKIAYRFNGTLQDITAERSAQNKIEASQRLADLALKSAGVGLFQFDLSTAEAKYSPMFAQIMTGDADKKGLNRNVFIRYVHPDDEHLRSSTIKSAIETGEFSYEPRVIWDDSSVHKVHVKGGTVYDKDGKPIALTGTIRDITEFEEQAIALQESESKFRSLIEEAPVATCLFTGPDLRIEIANEIMIGYWGKGNSVMGMPLRAALPELIEQPYIDILANIYKTGIAHQEHAAPVVLEVNGVMTNSYFDYTYKPLLDVQGKVYGIMNMAIDVTEQVLAQLELKKSQQQLLDYFEESPVAIAIITEENLTFRMANPFYAELVGRKPNELVNKPLLEALPELEGQGFDGLLQGVLDTGVSFIAKEVSVELQRNNKLETVYVDLTYQLQRTKVNHQKTILVVATDVTQQVTARRKVEDSENKLRSIISSAPAGIGLFVGRDLIIEHPNQTFIDIVGKGPGIEGLPLREAMPELITEGQPFLKILDDVFATGKMFQSYGSQVKIVQNGVLTDNYYNITYTPVFDANGDVYAILDLAIDVTEQIKAQQKLQEAETDLRGAVELAGLATWSLDIQSNTYSYSPRFMEWLGFSEDTKGLDEAYNPLPEEYRQLVIDAIGEAIREGSTGLYDFEHPIVNRTSGQVRIIHAQAQMSYDGLGNPISLRGTAQDITIQRQMQLALENEVQLRTEELAAMNEELLTTNEELGKSNNQLVHSNDELAQYAYVASHDLQEPLRKIRIFSDILNNKGDLQQDHRKLVSKISQSAERMRLLIQDLLEFSRLLKTETLMQPVSLTDVVLAVADDFELTINEKHARVEMEQLPVIEAVSLQMNQLFYNLMSNALKFTNPDVKPHIRIAAQQMQAAEIKKFIGAPLPYTNYYHITFTDNGIGFDAEYSEQIFEVFKRLHGRDHYPGSGIGLALCRRIVANHNGILLAESTPGVATIFHLILPDKQHNFESEIPEGFKWTND